MKKAKTTKATTTPSASKPKPKGVDLSTLVPQKGSTTTPKSPVLPRMSNAARGLMKAKKERIEELENQAEWAEAFQTEERIAAYQAKQQSPVGLDTAGPALPKSPALPALSHSQQCVLRGVKEAMNRSGGGRVFQRAILDRIVPVVDGCDAPGEKVAKNDLIALESLGLVDRNAGDRKGYALTDKGENAYQRMVELLANAKPKPAR